MTEGLVGQQRVTVIDVIEGFFQGVPTEADVMRLSRVNIEDFGERVMESANVLADGPVDDGLTYLGGWLAANWQERLFRPDLTLALLYYPSLLVHDPLAEFFFTSWDRVPAGRPIRARRNGMSISAGVPVWGPPRSYAGMRDDLDRARGHLAGIIGNLSAFAPLLREGVLIARPQLPWIVHNSQALQSSVRADVQSQAMHDAIQAAEVQGGLALPIWDNLRGMGITPSGGVRKSDERWLRQHEFFYLAKTLGVAAQYNARYTPATDGEAILARAKARQLGDRNLEAREHPVDILREVARLVVPDLDLDPVTAVKMRESEDAFREWRMTLRGLMVEPNRDSPEALQERVDDTLLPIIHRIEKAARVSSRMSSALREQGASTAISVSGTAFAGAVLGKGVTAGVVGGLTGGVLAWLYKAFLPPRFEGAQSVVASLIRKR